MSDVPLSNDPRYRSILVELLGVGEGVKVPARGLPYIVQVEDQPVRQVGCPLDYNDLLDRIEQLDYSVDDPAVRRGALDALASAVSDFLQQAKLGELTPPLQIDLVVTASELAALPFEVARDASGDALVGRRNVDIEITRRIRLPFKDHSERWRPSPRVLFVMASPPGAGVEVPYDENRRALRSALLPWIEPLTGVAEAMPDERNVLSMLPKASVKLIGEACEKAVAERKPFTHIHILAHGTTVGRGVRERFGLALHGDDGKLVAVEAADLAAALNPAAETCSVVTLAVCHGGADVNPIRPGSSLAHALHGAGCSAARF